MHFAFVDKPVLVFNVNIIIPKVSKSILFDTLKLTMTIIANAFCNVYFFSIFYFSSDFLRLIRNIF